MQAEEHTKDPSDEKAAREKAFEHYKEVDKFLQGFPPAVSDRQVENMPGFSNIEKQLLSRHSIGCS